MHARPQPRGHSLDDGLLDAQNLRELALDAGGVQQVVGPAHGRVRVHAYVECVAGGARLGVSFGGVGGGWGVGVGWVGLGWGGLGWGGGGGGGERVLVSAWRQ